MEATFTLVNVAEGATPSDTFVRSGVLHHDQGYCRQLGLGPMTRPVITRFPWAKLSRRMSLVSLFPTSPSFPAT